jgi:hypothetical protein
MKCEISRIGIVGISYSVRILLQASVKLTTSLLLGGNGINRKEWGKKSASRCGEEGLCQMNPKSDIVYALNIRNLLLKKYMSYSS